MNSMVNGHHIENMKSWSKEEKWDRACEPLHFEQSLSAFYDGATNISIQIRNI